MKKSTQSLLVVLGLTVVGLGVWHFRPRPEEKFTASTEAATPKKARDLFGEAVVKSAASPQAASSVPAECQSFWDYLSGQSLKQLTELLKRSELRWDEACLKMAEPKLLFAENILSKCLKQFDEKACEEALAMYRAEAIARIFAGEKDFSKLDSPTLMNLIMAQFLDPQLGGAKLAETKAMIQELLRKEPGLYAAEKALAGAIFIEGLQKMGPDKNVSPEVIAALERVRQLNPDDLEMWEMSIVPDIIRENFAAARQLADDIERNHPNSGLPHYYRAGAFWKEKNREATLSELRMAMQKEPENPRFRDTYQKVLATKPGDAGAFNVSMTFNFDGI